MDEELDIFCNNIFFLNINLFYSNFIKPSKYKNIFVFKFYVGSGLNYLKAMRKINFTNFPSESLFEGEISIQGSK